MGDVNDSQYDADNSELDAPKPATVPVVHNEDPRSVPEAVWRQVWFSELDDSDRVALGLGYLCGLRRREIVRLSAGNFLDDGHLTGIERKGGKVERFKC